MRLNVNPWAAVASFCCLTLLTAAIISLISSCTPDQPKFPPASGGRMIVVETQLMETGYRYIIIKDSKTGYEYLSVDHCGVTKLGEIR